MYQLGLRKSFLLYNIDYFQTKYVDDKIRRDISIRPRVEKSKADFSEIFSAVVSRTLVTMLQLLRKVNLDKDSLLKHVQTVIFIRHKKESHDTPSLYIKQLFLSVCLSGSEFHQKLCHQNDSFLLKIMQI